MPRASIRCSSQGSPPAAVYAPWGVDCVSSNFRTVVIKEACGDRDPPAHEANLYDLGAKYADMVSLDEALRLLETVTVAA